MRCSALLFTLLACLQIHAGETKPYELADPTAAEQHVLQIINRARLDPEAEGKRLGIDLTESLKGNEKRLLKPVPPLRMNPQLLAAARKHSQDMYTRVFFEHENPDKKTPFDRVRAAGYDYNIAAENISAGSNHSADKLQDRLMIDDDTPDRGHRKNLLDLQPKLRPLLFQEIGIGMYDAAEKNEAGFRNYLTQKFGTIKKSGPFLLGVVYKDENANGFYDPGEGLSGVTIKSSRGPWYAVSTASGGWSFPATPGKQELTASGDGFEGAAAATVNPGSENIEVDFVSGKSEAIINFGIK